MRYDTGELMLIVVVALVMAGIVGSVLWDVATCKERGPAYRAMRFTMVGKVMVPYWTDVRDCIRR